MITLRVNDELRTIDAPPDMPSLWVLRSALANAVFAATGVRLRRMPIDRLEISAKKSA
jgi:hypothetical protein